MEKCLKKHNIKQDLITQVIILNVLERIFSNKISKIFKKLQESLMDIMFIVLSNVLTIQCLVHGNLEIWQKCNFAILVLQQRYARTFSDKSAHYSRKTAD